MATKVKLFAFPYSPFSQRVQIALTEKGIPFELVQIDFSNKPKELLEANPVHGKIPTIIHDGKPMAESLVILEYLEDAWPQQVPLLPDGAYEKSEVSFWADYIYQFFANSQPAMSAKPGSPEMEAALVAREKSFNLLEEAMTKFSAEGPFFTGDKFGHLDVVLSPLINFLPLMQSMGGSVPSPDKLPRLHKCIEAIKSHPSVIKSMPKVEDTVNFFTAMIKKRQAAAAQ